MEDLIERNIKEEYVERKSLARYSTKSWKDRDLLLVESSPLEKLLTTNLLMVPSLSLFPIFSQCS